MAKDENTGNDGLTPEQQRQFDEGAALLGDSLPGLWRRMYENCITHDFTEQQAIELVKAYILSQCPHGIRGTDS